MALQLNYNNNIIYECFTDIEVLKQIDNTLTNTLTKTIIIPNAYVKINKQTGDKSTINITVGICDKKDSKLILAKTYEFTPDISDTASNFIKQGYEYLKTLDEFKDATDLLDEGQSV